MMDEKILTGIENEKSETINTEETAKAENFTVNIPAQAPEEAETAIVADTTAVPEKTAVKPQVKDIKKAPANKAKRRVPAKSQKQIKEEKKAKNTVMLLSCIMALITIVTAVTGSVTDVFKGEDVKAVAVLILPQEDKEELEKHLSKLWPLANAGFDTEKMSGEELFDYIKPYSEDGLYTSFGYSATAVTHEADPAGRFRDENGKYCYFRIPRAEIDSILSHFGLEENHALNSESAYYYDAHYYFAHSDKAEEKVSGKVTVLDSKRIQDGRYYVTVRFGKKEVYVTASMIEGETGWKIHSMSLTPVYDSLGIMIKNESEINSDYEMRESVIEGKAEDGTVFRKYIIKYPYFFGETQGEIQANNFYSSVITFYQQQSQQIQSEYNKFKKKGGKTDSLPLETHYTAQVSFSDESNLCLINEITESVAMYKNSEDIKLPLKTMECNTFDVETGVYVAKDNLVGKDYITLSKILYRIYNGYGYEALLDSSVSDISVPDDTYKLGEKIYNSASTFCKDGYVFCYINSDGLRKDVVLPFDTVEKLKSTEQ